MTVSAQVMFPGVYFEVAPPAIATVLPRMDIAAFVGYASAGPLHTPVAVEDIQRYRELFGADLDLAWDPERNATEKSCLGSAVDAFFRNGGQRCWVVRVADETLAMTARFQIPGLLRTDGSVLEQSFAEARSPGSWARGLSSNTVLEVTQLPLNHAGAAQVYLSVDESGWYARLLADPASVNKGDLLRCVPFEGTTLFLVVDSTEASNVGVQVAGREAYLSIEPTTSSPPLFDSSQRLEPSVDLDAADSAAPVLFAQSAFDDLGISREWVAGAASPEDELYALEHLRFSWLVNDAHKTQWKLSALGFCSGDNRFWGMLPSDRLLYQGREGRPSAHLSPTTEALINEAGNPRFPLCSPFSAQGASHGWTYLPLGMPNTLDSSRRSHSDISALADPLSVDGIENAGSRIFLDERLASVGSAVLRQEADQLAFLGDHVESLKGIHSLVRVEEATLIAVPDAIHRRWDDAAPLRETPLAAPELEGPLHAGSDSAEDCAGYSLHWSAVADASRYRLQWSAAPEFAAAEQVVLEGESLYGAGGAEQLIPAPPTEFCIEFGHDCPRVFYFRVRSENRNEVSVWSNHVAAMVPEADFYNCIEAPVESLAVGLELNDTALAVSASPAEALGEFHVLRLGDASDGIVGLGPLGDTFIERVEVQRSREHSFLAVEVLYDADWLGLDTDVGGVCVLPVEMLPDTTFYYRARGKARETTGAWSNTLTVNPLVLSRKVIQPAVDFSDRDLLAVHRALLRLSHARSDVFAALSLPRHYTVSQARNHVARLAPGSGEPEPAGEIAADALSARVAPLGLAENATMSYAGVYYPWLACQVGHLQAGGASIRFIPPDGPVVGKIAASSIAQGAWIAPANSPLNSALALQTIVTRPQWAELMQSRINVIREDSRGFLLLSADTLSRSSELAEISVRRLIGLLLRLARREGNRFVFEPNSAALAERVQAYFEGLFDQLYARGAFAGGSSREAYRVVSDATVNSRQSLEAGRFIVELQVAPSQPLKFIRIRLVQAGPNQLHIQEVAG